VHENPAPGPIKKTADASQSWNDTPGHIWPIHGIRGVSDNNKHMILASCQG